MAILSADISGFAAISGKLSDITLGISAGHVLMYHGYHQRKRRLRPYSPIYFDDESDLCPLRLWINISRELHVIQAGLPLVVSSQVRDCLIRNASIHYLKAEIAKAINFPWSEQDMSIVGLIGPEDDDVLAFFESQPAVDPKHPYPLFEICPHGYTQNGERSDDVWRIKRWYTNNEIRISLDSDYMARWPVVYYGEGIHILSLPQCKYILEYCDPRYFEIGIAKWSDLDRVIEMR